MKRLSIIVAFAALAVNLAACDALSPDADKPFAAAPSSGPGAPAANKPLAAPALVPVSPPARAEEDNAALSVKVRRALQAPEGIGGLEVDAANGVVTLYGTVDAPADRERAALVAMGVEGVRSVVNNLVVVRGS